MDNEKQAFSYSINLFIQNKLAAASGFPGSGGSSGSQQKGDQLSLAGVGSRSPRNRGVS